MTEENKPLYTNADVIEDLEELVERAKRGQVQGFAIAYTTPSNEVRSTYSSGAANCHILNSGVSLLQWRLNNLIFTERTDVEDLHGDSGQDSIEEDDVPEEGTVVPIGRKGVQEGNST